MRKKIWIVGACMALFLTACGTPDAVADEMKRVAASAGFEGSVEDAKAFARAVEKGEEHREPVVVPEQTAKDLDALAAFLEKKLAEEKIRPLRVPDYEDDMVQETEDTRQEELFTGEQFTTEVEVNNDEEVFGNLKDWRSTLEEEMIFAGNCPSVSSSFEVDAKEIDGFLEGLAGIGFEGLVVPGERTGGSSHVVSRGVEFDIMDMSEDGEAYYRVLLDVQAFVFAHPQKYADLLEHQMKDAFSTSHIMCGGYLEYIRFSGGTMLPQNSYEKNTEIYFREGKPIQANLLITANDEHPEGGIFTEAEQEELGSLLAWLSGDEKAARAFIAGLDANKDKKGTIGSVNWYQIGSLELGEYMIRFEPDR